MYRIRIGSNKDSELAPHQDPKETISIPDPDPNLNDVHEGTCRPSSLPQWEMEIVRISAWPVRHTWTNMVI